MMTGRERTARILARKPVDRIGLFEHFWSDTARTWEAQGFLRPGEFPSDHFGFDMDLAWALNFTADLDFVPETVEETAETILQRDGNGALLRHHKLHDATPEHVGFLVSDREGWEERIRPLLVPDPRRIDFEGYRRQRAHHAAKDRFFFLAAINAFEQMFPVVGHENLLAGMALDPDWVRGMADTYSRLSVALMEILFDREGWPDGLWFYEDMGFKAHPFFSPAMYREILQAAHRRTIGFAKAHGLPVVMHSCGFVEPLVPLLVESGIDCLQVIECKAGMDLLRLHRDFGGRLSLMGGLDARVLSSNDPEALERELADKIPVVKEGFGYVAHSDHSIPSTVEYGFYKRFTERVLELGRYG